MITNYDPFHTDYQVTGFTRYYLFPSPNILLLIDVRKALAKLRSCINKNFMTTPESTVFTFTFRVPTIKGFHGEIAYLLGCFF
jgi:hypothetical protein